MWSTLSTSGSGLFFEVSKAQISLSSALSRFEPIWEPLKSAQISSNQLWGFILDYFWGFQGSNQLILDLQISSNQLWGFILGYFLRFPRLKSAYLLRSAQISSNQLWGFIFDYFLRFPRLKSAYLRPWADLSRFEGPLKSAQISSEVSSRTIFGVSNMLTRWLHIRRYIKILADAGWCIVDKSNRRYYCFSSEILGKWWNT